MATATWQYHPTTNLHGSCTKQAAGAGKIADLRPEHQLSEEDRQQILSFRHPEFRSPEFTARYSLEMNHHEAKACKDTVQWLLDHHVDSIFSPEDYNKFLTHDCGNLAARVYVDAGHQGISWAAKFVVWLFAFDDVMDNTVTGMSPESSLSFLLELSLALIWSFPENPQLQEKLMVIVDAFPSSELKKGTLEVIHDELSKAKRFPGTVYDGKLSPLGLCLRDMWANVLEAGSQISSIRIAHSILCFFVGNLEETRNREDKATPSIADYISLRRRSSAMIPCLAMVDFVYKVQASNDLYDSSQMQLLLDAANDVVSWHNDLWSFRKEVLRGDPHNLVFVVSQERKCSYTEAALLCRDMIDSRVADLRKAAADLQAFADPADQHVVSAYITTCLCWLSGTEAWHRYEFETEDA